MERHANIKVQYGMSTMLRVILDALEGTLVLDESQTIRAAFEVACQCVMDQGCETHEFPPSEVAKETSPGSYRFEGHGVTIEIADAARWSWISMSSQGEGFHDFGVYVGHDGEMPFVFNLYSPYIILRPRLG